MRFCFFQLSGPCPVSPTLGAITDMMRNFTFERILAAYIALAAILAVVLPYGLRIEDLLPVSPSAIPFARWLSLAPSSLPFLSTYFFILSALVPVVVVGLAFNPQEAHHFTYAVPSLGRCVLASLFVVVIVLLFWQGMFLDYPPRETANGNARIAYYAAVSRFGLAVFGPLVMGTTALVAYIALVKLPSMWAGYRNNQFG